IGARAGPHRIACGLLGLDPEEKRTSWGGSSKDWQAPLRTRADDQGGDGLATVALALAFAAVEEGLRGEWHAWGGAPDRTHFRFLEALGYALSDFEATKLREAEEEEEQLDGEDANPDEGPDHPSPSTGDGA